MLVRLKTPVIACVPLGGILLEHEDSYIKAKSGATGVLARRDPSLSSPLW